MKIAKEFVEGLSAGGHRASLKIVNAKSVNLTELEHDNYPNGSAGFY